MGHQHSAWTQEPSTDSATGQSVPLLGRGTQLLLCSQVPVAPSSDLQETQKQNSAHVDIWISPGATGISFVPWLLIPLTRAVGCGPPMPRFRAKSADTGPVSPRRT